MICEHADKIEYELKLIVKGGLAICNTPCPYQLKRVFEFDDYDYLYCSENGEVPEEKSKLTKITAQPNPLAA